jgi:hypothetical protein
MAFQLGDMDNNYLLKLNKCLLNKRMINPGPAPLERRLDTGARRQ